MNKLFIYSMVFMTTWSYSLELPKEINLQAILDISKFKNIKKIVEFPDQYEKPFLVGIPNDLPIDLVAKNQNGPHCWQKFNSRNPWYSINYERLPYIYIFSEMFIDPLAYGLIFNKTQKLILKYDCWTVFDNDVKFKNNSKIIKIDKALHLLQRCSEGYYHFVIEVLPRLILALDYIQKDKSIKILMSPPYKKFMDEYFELLEIDKNRIIYCDLSSIYFVKELYFPKPAFMGYPSKEELSRVRNYILKKSKTADDLENGEIPLEKRDLIIIIERLEKGRHVNNTHEIVTKIKKKFPSVAEKVVIFNGKCSVKEQINLFKRAQIIIGPHGAGYTNMIFSSPHTFNIEFLPLQYFTLLYWHVAEAIGITHKHIIIPNAHKDSSFNVNPREVIIRLEQKFGKFNNVKKNF